MNIRCKVCGMPLDKQGVCPMGHMPIDITPLRTSPPWREDTLIGWDPKVYASWVAEQGIGE